MALNIKNNETEKLARELARRRSQGITDVVTEALRNELARERRRPRRGAPEDFHRRIQVIVDEVKQLQVLEGGARLIGLDEDLFV